MMVAILCTGPSMSPHIAEDCRRLPTIAVNATFRLVPWAVAVAANDPQWWRNHADVEKFPGRKFSGARVRGTELVQTVHKGTCSGVLALEVAKQLGATTVLLYGADGGSAHYFGPYTGEMVNAAPSVTQKHADQFAAWAAANPDILVLNMSPTSTLECFERG